MTEHTTQPEDHHRLITAMRKEEQQRQNGYREQAMKLFPPVCGRCSREFSGKGLRELTVHHKDHNHDNNPPDGSNWELLCVYCHDHEHTRGLQEREAGGPDASNERPTLVHSPFAALAAKLKQAD
ncbi:MAG: YajD family HNH nuclease [Desulfuromonadales bacterium]|nr:YajD family HNH nuclease [Desulfuromonadales bacterium]